MSSRVESDGETEVLIPCWENAPDDGLRGMPFRREGDDAAPLGADVPDLDFR